MYTLRRRKAPPQLASLQRRSGVDKNLLSQIWQPCAALSRPGSRTGLPAFDSADVLGLESRHLAAKKDGACVEDVRIIAYEGHDPTSAQ